MTTDNMSDMHALLASALIPGARARSANVSSLTLMTGDIVQQ